MSSLGSHSKDGFRTKTLVSQLLFPSCLGTRRTESPELEVLGKRVGQLWGGVVLLLGEEGRGGLSERGAAP